MGMAFRVFFAPAPFSLSGNRKSTDTAIVSSSIGEERKKYLVYQSNCPQRFLRRF